MHNTLKDFFTKTLKYNFWAFEVMSDFVLEYKIQDDYILKQLSHTLNANKVWLSRIQGETFKIDPFFVHPPITWLPMIQSDEAKCSQLLEFGPDLETQIQYTTRDGKPHELSLGEIFFILINHATHHRGQVAARIRQMGLEPPITDYPHYCGLMTTKA